jgi:hypothetical protein
MGTLVDMPSRVATLFAPFRRFAAAGRLAAALFTPGWATGIPFLAILFATCLAGWLGCVQRFLPPQAEPPALAAAVLVIATVVYPLPFVVCFSRLGQRLLVVLLVQLVCFLSFILANVAKPFGTPWPEPAQHPALVQHAVHAFNLLRDSLRAMHGNRPEQHAQADRQAMFIWSTLHGMASITQANVMQHLSLASGVQHALPADLMARIGLGLSLPERVLPATSPSKPKRKSRP